MALYNLRNPAVKRLMKEAEELRFPTEEYYAQPLEDNLFEWHFTLRGQPNTDYEGGIYHGRITLPPDYPMKPPSIILLTPNGRFEINKKICLSISGHHPESWQPSWSIRTALLAMIGFMPTHGNGAIGSLEYTPEERQQLALKSQEWKCPECGLVKRFLGKTIASSDSEENKSLMTCSKLADNGSVCNISTLSASDYNCSTSTAYNEDTDFLTNTSANVLSAVRNESEVFKRKNVKKDAILVQPSDSSVRNFSVENYSTSYSSIIIFIILLIMVILFMRRIFFL